MSLRPYRPEDQDILRFLRDDPVTQHLLLAHPEKRDPADNFENWLARRQAEPSGGLWVAVDPGDAAAGFAQLTGVHRQDRHARFGVALHPAFRGMNIGRATMAALFSLAREKSLRKLLCEVRSDNRRAIALYLGLGFRTVGTLLRHYDDGTRVWDVDLMEMELEQGR